MPVHTSRLRAIAFGVALAATSLGASAQTWPAKPVTLVLPFPAGGATDAVARTLASTLSQKIGQSVLVDNKPGAGGAIGSRDVQRATPDGYTLLLATSSTHAVSPNLLDLPYNVVTDFTPIAQIATAASVVLVTPSLPVQNIEELIDYAKAHPRELNFASSGLGTVVHLSTEAFNAQAGVQMTHVPYKGTGQAIADLVSGSVQVLFDAIPTGMPQVQGGRLRALAVTGTERSPLAPEVPTVAESGLPGYSSVTWFGIYGPKDMPEALVGQIHDAFDEVLRAPAVISSFDKLGVDATPGVTTAEFAEMAAKDRDRWGQLIRERNITVN